MTHGVPAPAGAGAGDDWKAARDRREARQLDMRHRRDRRALAAELQERYERDAVPLNEEMTPPRID